jgi:hypothetical protein
MVHLRATRIELVVARVEGLVLGTRFGLSVAINIRLNANLVLHFLSPYLVWKEFLLELAAIVHY